MQVEYDALSYCWGKPELTRSILINGLDYPITTTLYEALQRIRKHSEIRHLWVDALCINQHDLDERSLQVANMLTIFSKAQQVICWLGEHGFCTKLCCTYFEAQEAAKEIAPLSTLLTKACSKHQNTLRLGFRELLDRPWYTRVWIRQELWAAQRIVVACGDSIFGWDCILNVVTNHASFNLWLSDGRLKAIRGLGMAEPFARATVEDARLSNRYRSTAGLSSTPTDLLSVIQRTSNCGCTDDRDRVYGILGMTTVKSLSALNTTRIDSSYGAHPWESVLSVSDIWWCCR